jgi:hypothetical protein
MFRNSGVSIAENANPVAGGIHVGETKICDPLDANTDNRRAVDQAGGGAP